MISLLHACREKQVEEEDCESKVEGLRAAAKKAKSMYSKLKTAENVDLDNLLLHGGTAEENDSAAAVVEKMQRERVFAARARRDYDRAVRSLNKIRDNGDDSMMGEGDEDSEYDTDESDLAASWDSHDDLSSDEGDREDDDTTDLPDLDHAKKPHVPAPVFEVLGDEQTTWSAVWDKVRAALVHRGHKCRTLVRVIERVEGKTSRPKRMELTCRNAGQSRATPRVADPSKHRNTQSAKCQCPFKVKVSWGVDSQPKMLKVCLDHAEACNAEETANARQDLVPTERIESECEDDIRDWTTTGLRQFDMYRLVSDRIKPLQLGDPGRQKECDGVWSKIEDLVKGSGCEKYVKGYLKELSSKRASLGKQHVEDRVLKSAEPLMRQLESVGGSTYARNELTAEMLASAAYDTSVLAEGQGCHDYLERLATQAGDHLDVCAQVPEEAFRGSKAPDISMWGTTSLGSFVEVVRNVKIDCVVHVVYKYTDRPVGHIVVVGPDGFQLCTCLRLMRCGLHCSHTLAALVTKLGRAEEFLGESIHPRWRTSLEPWSLYSAGLSPFDGHERGTYTDGFTGDYGDMDLEDSQDGPAGGAVSIPRGRFYADFFARVTKLVSAASDNYDGTPASYARYIELFDRFGRDVNATIMAPVVADGVTGLGNPPLPVSKTRKETRHKDGFEGRAKKKAKGGDTTSCVDVAN
eukprot:jgi/Undpi1/11569/HiC_scaffold_30.g13866.m1